MGRGDDMNLGSHPVLGPDPGPGPSLSGPAHAADAAEVIRSLGSDAGAGLTPEEAASRLAVAGPNELREAPGPTAWERLLAQFRSPLIYVLAVAIAISTAAWLVEGTEGLPVDAMVIAAIMVLNAAIGFVQERRAEDAVARLRTLSAPTATVIRGAVTVECPVVDIVPGDLVVLHEGDIVPADGRIVEAHALSIAEAVLTGESEASAKGVEPVSIEAPLGDRTSMAHAGTSVVAGSGRVVVTATGMGTEMGEIAELLATTEEPSTPLELEIARVGRVLGAAVVVISAVVAAVTWWVSGVDTLSEAGELLLIGVSLAVAAVPEGLPAVLSLVLAMGTRRMAARRALIKRLAFAETLGSTSVICTDKTGTLTRNRMTVQRIATSAGEHDPDLPAPPQAVELLRAAVLASDAEVRSVDGTNQNTGDPTEVALVLAAGEAGLDVDMVRSEAPRLDETPFDSLRKRMAVLVAGGADGSPLLVVKGAPEVVLPLCSHEGSLGSPAPLAGDREEEWNETVDRFAGAALRTLAIAARPLPEATSCLRDEDEVDLILLGVVGILDPPREEVADAVAAAKRAGIRVVMVTGDHPVTALRIAVDVGIAGPGDRVAGGADLDVEPGSGRDAVVLDHPVFARVAPRHKLELVERFQAQGHVVAMTGDGVNDAPALKAADIGVAMGIAGSDVSKGAADMILADDNFATIVAAVEEGRAIFANVASFMRYLLSSNMGEVLTMFLGVVFATVIGLDAAEGAIVAPLVATQILWINLLTDTGPALALGADPVDEGVMLAAPRRRSDRLMDASMFRSVVIYGFTMAVATLAMLDAKLPDGLVEGDADLDTARTAAFTVLVIAQLFNAFNTRSDERSAFHRPGSNPWLVAAVLVSLLLQVAVVHVPALNEAFSTAPLTLGDWLLCAAFASSVLWVGEIRLLMRHHVFRRAPA